MARLSKPFLDRFLVGLTDPEEAAAYLRAAAEDSDESLLVALQDVVRANQVTSIAKKVKVAREHLYRSLTAKGNPGIRLFRRILRTLDMDFIVVHRSAREGQPSKPKLPSRTIGYKSRIHRNIGSQQLGLPFAGSQAIVITNAAAAIAPFVLNQDNAANNRALAHNLGLSQQQGDTEDIWKSLQDQKHFNQLVRELPMTLLTAIQTTVISRPLPSI